MLLLNRQNNQSIMIGDDIEVKVLGIQNGQVRLGITDPNDVAVDRLEIRQSKDRDSGDGNKRTVDSMFKK